MILTHDDWGRIIALLAARDGDIAGAEDAVAGAVERALHTWPSKGIPQNPSGWIYRTALNMRRDVWKSAAHRTTVELDSEVHETAQPSVRLDFDELPDRRLQLLAACAHPDIDPATRPLLMLSAVLGLPTRRIAEGMILPAATVAARLTRAKKKIATKGLQMYMPDRSELPACLSSIHEAIYGVFTIEWANAATDLREGVAGEAVYLSELVSTLCPDDGESHGLAALIHLSVARFNARRDPDGALVPLDDQDPIMWETSHVAKGEWHLREVHRCGEVGRYVIEASIQALHMQGVRTRKPNWHALLRQHDHLLTLAPSLAARVSRAAILQHVEGAAAALDALSCLPKAAEGYQPAWVLRSHLYRAAGRDQDAISTLERAMTLTTVISEHEHLAKLLNRWKQRV
ncbi:RNA polymerase sigma factor [Brachybacterium huguangmaarense]